MPTTCNLQRFRLRAPAVGLALLLAALARPAIAQDFVSSNRTVVGGNPMDVSYSGQSVHVGVSGFVNGNPIRVTNVQVDIVAPAQLNFSEATGGSLWMYSNSQVTVQGGTFGSSTTFASVGRTTLADTSVLNVQGGSLGAVTVNGAAAGLAGARVIVTDGQLLAPSGAGAIVQNGGFSISGGSLQATATNVQPALYGLGGSIISMSGGTVQSATSAAVYLGAGSVFSMTGGTVTGGPGGNAQWGVRTEGVATGAVLNGGTVNGGIRTTAGSNQSTLQAVLGGTLAVNGGVFAYGNAAVDVTGGSYSRFAGANASFFAMGANTVNFYGTDLALSGPTVGSVFETNNYSGNFYTFTSGMFSDGQSAVGLRLFDAVSVGGNPLGGGFTLNPSPVPEPATALLLLMALPAIGVAVRRRCRIA